MYAATVKSELACVSPRLAQLTCAEPYSTHAGNHPPSEQRAPAHSRGCYYCVLCEGESRRGLVGLLGLHCFLQFPHSLYCRSGRCLASLPFSV